MLMRWWRKRLRSIDLRVLWPICKQQALTVDHAKAAFMVHCMGDHAWSDLSEAEIITVINNL